MLNYQVKIGLVPIRRDCTPRPGIFNWEKGEARALKQVAYIEEHFADEHVSFVDLKGINEVDVLFNEKDVPAVVKRFQDEKVDAVMVINGNFGNEEVAAMVAKAVGKPVLLWGPIDDEFLPDGQRFYDSQCGLFGISRLMQRRHIPFTYIENCHVEDDIFAEGFDEFVRVACMVKNFTHLRVGMVGMRPKPFTSVIYNEGELMERFDISVIPINLSNFQVRFEDNLKNHKEELKALESKFVGVYEFDEASKEQLEKMCCFILTYQKLFEEFDLDCISAECWTAMQQLVGAMPCAAYGPLADMGYIIGCESDTHATITQVLLKCAALGEKVPFLGEFTTRHPSDRNAELLWHCGPFAPSLANREDPVKLVNMRAYLHVKDGHYTVARLDQDNGAYKILVGECDSTTGPYTFGTFMWGEFKNLPAWERKLIEGPYIHHMSEVEGSYTKVFKEFCKYIPGLELDSVAE